MLNMKKLIPALMIMMIAFAACASAAEDGGFVTGDYAAGDFRLAAGGAAADIYVDPGDYKVVKIAAEALAGDIELVTGVRPQVKSEPGVLGTDAVIIGTIEKNGLIAALVESGRLDVSGIKGSWETFVITTVESPFPGVKNALVIAGSDRRGAAFGAFELSQNIGVSPWVWWADVTPYRKDSLIVKKGTRRFGPPSVKFRGIFLNDENFGLKPWAAKTFEPEVGDIGPRTYAKIFELLLRLKANHIWPAMHSCTRAFNYYKDNPLVADDYAIVMGSSHCEQMLRNNVDEWKQEERGPWNYKDNKKGVYDYWEERVRANGGFENVYTIGIRGVHDTPMVGGAGFEEQVEILKGVISDQRGLLSKWVNDDASQVPQIFCPYKEVLNFYRAGLDLPGDITLVWPDDNYGYIRQLSTPEEQARPGGAGVYYHISYWGVPHDYLWLYTTPPALIWEEMNKAYQYNGRTVWILNVGDLKPGEIGIEFFLQMAWDIERWNIDNLPDFLVEWAAREFGAEYSRKIADVMNRYFIANYPRKPEHMGFYERMAPVLKNSNNDPEFSLYHYGDEVQRRIDEFVSLEREASAVYDSLPEEKRDAYFQLVLYPVHGAAYINLKHLYGFKNRKYFGQGRMIANDYLEKTKEVFTALKKETLHYNNTMAGGKWQHMMDDDIKGLPVSGKVKLLKLKPEKGSKLGVIVEGEGIPAHVKNDAETEQPGQSHDTLPRFNRYTKRRYFIDLFNSGDKPFEWRAECEDWILLTEASGSIDDGRRILVDIDYARAPKGAGVEGGILISGAGSEYLVKVSLFNPAEPNLEGKVFVQDNGVIAMNASNFDRSMDHGTAGWRTIRGLGRTGAALALMPFTAPTIKPGMANAANAPSVEYPVYVFEQGNAGIIIHAVPTHRIHEGGHLRVAVSVDGGAPVELEFEQAHEEVDKIGKINVLRNMMEGKAEITLSKGAHTISIFGVEAGVVLDRIFIDFGGIQKSYLWPLETVLVSR